MKLVFLGTSGFAVPALRALAAQSDVMIAAVISRPDRPAGRGRRLRRPPVAEVADELGLHLIQPEKLLSVRDQVASLSPDCMVSASYGGWLPEWFLGIAPLGVVNIHPSLLPRHRGAAPIIRAVLEGDKVTGVSFMVTDSGWDTGDLLQVFRYPLKPQMTSGELEEILSRKAAEHLPDVLRGYAEGTLTSQPQSHGETYAEKVSPEESILNWNESSEKLSRKILAFNPVPGARTEFNGKILKIHRADSVQGTGRPGEVLSVSPLVVACGEQALALMELQPQGGRRMFSGDFARGYRLEAGDRLGSES